MTTFSKIILISIAMILVSCADIESYKPVRNLKQIDGFWKCSSNTIEFKTRDSILIFNNLKKHKIEVYKDDSSFFVQGKNMNDEISFEGLIKINEKGDKLNIKRFDNHNKLLFGSKYIFSKINY